MMAYRTDIRPCGQGGRSPGVRLYDDLCGLILSSSILKGRWRLPNRHKRVVPTIGIHTGVDTYRNGPVQSKVRVAEGLLTVIE